MSTLQPIQVDENTVIYIETTEPLINESFMRGAIAPEPEETTRTAKGLSSFNSHEHVVQSFQLVENTIKTYTQRSINAFRDLALANVRKVTLEFGVNISGASGIPYIASGTAGCNIKITVECDFPNTQTL